VGGDAFDKVNYDAQTQTKRTDYWRAFEFCDGIYKRKGVRRERGSERGRNGERERGSEGARERGSEGGGKGGREGALGRPFTAHLKVPVSLYIIFYSSETECFTRSSLRPWDAQSLAHRLNFFLLLWKTNVTTVTFGAR
jgi:hypothetical protein